MKFSEKLRNAVKREDVEKEFYIVWNRFHKEYEVRHQGGLTPLYKGSIEKCEEFKKTVVDNETKHR